MSYQSAERRLESVIEDIATSVTIRIEVSLQNGNRAGGTGFVVSSDSRGSYIITNSHVVEDIRNDGNEMTHYPTGQKSGFRVIERLPMTYADIALLQTNREFARPPRIGSSYNLKPGDKAFMFGYPLSEPRFASGTFAGRDYNRKSTSVDRYNMFASQGSSGSGIFNARGEIIGVLYAGLGEGQSSHRTLACPGDHMRRLLSDNNVVYRPGTDDSSGRGALDTDTPRATQHDRGLSSGFGSSDRTSSRGPSPIEPPEGYDRMYPGRSHRGSSNIVESWSDRVPGYESTSLPRESHRVRDDYPPRDSHYAPRNDFAPDDPYRPRQSRTDCQPSYEAPHHDFPSCIPRDPYRPRQSPTDYQPHYEAPRHDFPSYIPRDPYGARQSRDDHRPSYDTRHHDFPSYIPRDPYGARQSQDDHRPSYDTRHHDFPSYDPRGSYRPIYARPSYDPHGSSASMRDRRPSRAGAPRPGILGHRW